MPAELGRFPGVATELQRLPQFARFAIVGALGLIVDIAVLMTCMHVFGLDPYSGRVVSYLCAATVTWYMNRHFTFAARAGVHRGKEWLLFVLCSSFAGVLNYGAYALFVYLAGQGFWLTSMGVGLGACAGLLVNYTLSRRLVFRHTADVKP